MRSCGEARAASAQKGALPPPSLSSAPTATPQTRHTAAPSRRAAGSSSLSHEDALMSEPPRPALRGGRRAAAEAAATAARGGSVPAYFESAEASLHAADERHVHSLRPGQPFPSGGAAAEEETFVVDAGSGWKAPRSPLDAAGSSHPRGVSGRRSSAGNRGHALSWLAPPGNSCGGSSSSDAVGRRGGGGR